jgi:hypothetical protein
VKRNEPLAQLCEQSLCFLLRQPPSDQSGSRPSHYRLSFISIGITQPTSVSSANRRAPLCKAKKQDDFTPADQTRRRCCFCAFALDFTPRRVEPAQAGQLLDNQRETVGEIICRDGCRASPPTQASPATQVAHANAPSQTSFRIPTRPSSNRGLCIGSSPWRWHISLRCTSERPKIELTN